MRYRVYMFFNGKFIKAHREDLVSQYQADMLTEELLREDYKILKTIIDYSNLTDDCEGYIITEKFYVKRGDNLG